MFVFSRIRTEYGEIIRISPYSERIREIQTRKTANTDNVTFINEKLFNSSLYWRCYYQNLEKQSPGSAL